MKNSCNRGDNVFQIIFKSGQALLLSELRFSCPRIGREEGRGRLRNMYGSWPRTRHSRSHDLVQYRTRTQTVRVRERSASASCPRQQSRSQTVRIHGLATDSIVHDRTTAVVTDCPQTVRSRSHPCSRIGHGRQLIPPAAITNVSDFCWLLFFHILPMMGASPWLF